MSARDPIPAYVHLLRATGDSVTDISLLVGFRSLGSFSSAFRSLTGESPSGYRAAWRGREPAAIPGCHTLMWNRALSEKPPRPGGDSVAA